jgi:hypothetical protein
MKYHERKPDLDLESMRIWKAEKNSEEAKELDAVEDTFDIKYKDITMKACGFNVLRSKKTKEVFFAYKIKRNEGDMLLYYFKENLTESEKVDSEKIMQFFRDMQKNGFIGEMRDIKSTLESAYMEMNRKNDTN